MFLTVTDYDPHTFFYMENGSQKMLLSCYSKLLNQQGYLTNMFEFQVWRNAKC